MCVFYIFMCVCTGALYSALALCRRSVLAVHDAQGCWTEFSPSLSSLSSVLEACRRRQTRYSDLTHVHGRFPPIAAQELGHQERAPGISFIPEAAMNMVAAHAERWL